MLRRTAFGQRGNRDRRCCGRGRDGGGGGSGGDRRSGSMRRSGPEWLASGHFSDTGRVQGRDLPASGQQVGQKVLFVRSVRSTCMISIANPHVCCAAIKEPTSTRP